MSGNTKSTGHPGHPRRLRHRLLTGGAGAVADYGLLKLVLFLSHARGDVKPLAKELFRQFDGFAETISVSERRAPAHG